MNSMFAGAKVFNRKLCGAAWVASKASKTNIFYGCLGSISSTVCTSLHDGRELVMHLHHSNTVCRKCGVFKKSGRLSCCAPGGSWYKNCGSEDNANVDHRWLEGVKACNRKCRVE